MITQIRFVPSSTCDTLELYGGLHIWCVPWDPPFYLGYLSIDFTLLANSSSIYGSNLNSKREKFSSYPPSVTFPLDFLA